jgi:protein-disulfide isomerase
MADAKALKVVQTPTFFVNGKPLREHGFEQLRALVREEVRAQYK